MSPSTMDRRYAPSLTTYVSRDRPHGIALPDSGTQLGELVERPLPAAEEHHHQQVHEREREWIAVVAGPVHDQDPATRSGRFGAATEDRLGLGIVPVVHDAGQDVEIAAGWQRIEHAALDDLRTVGDAGRREALTDEWDH